MARCRAGETHGATCSNISLSGNTVTRLTGSQTLGFRIDASTLGASLIGNRVDPGVTFDYVLMSDCRMAGNIGKVTTFNGSTYFAEDQGRHTLAPTTSPPVSAPAGTAFAAGDIVYHAAPVSGGNLGWVWTGAAGWNRSERSGSRDTLLVELHDRGAAGAPDLAMFPRPVVVVDRRAWPRARWREGARFVGEMSGADAPTRSGCFSSAR